LPNSFVGKVLRKPIKSKPDIKPLFEMQSQCKCVVNLLDRGRAVSRSCLRIDR
jgi:hypothetical protein